jgi:hypothetical protein
MHTEHSQRHATEKRQSHIDDDDEGIHGIAGTATEEAVGRSPPSMNGSEPLEPCRCSRGRVGVHGKDGERIIIPPSIVGSGPDLEVDEVGEKHSEDGNDGMEGELQSGSKSHTATRGSSGGGRGTNRGVGDRSGISEDDAKRRDREDGVHLGGGGRRRGDELVVDGSGLDLCVRCELKLDVHGVDGGGSSTRSDLRRTSSLASLLVQSRLRWPSLPQWRQGPSSGVHLNSPVRVTLAMPGVVFLRRVPRGLLPLGELALKGVFSGGFPCGFPCALGPKNGRKFTGDGPP